MPWPPPNGIPTAEPWFNPFELLPIFDWIEPIGPTEIGADDDLRYLTPSGGYVFNGDDVPEKLQTYARYQWERQSVQLWVNQER